MNKVLGRNFSKKHCKDCKEASKVEEVKEELDMLDKDDFTHKLYGAISGVVEEFKDKGLTHGDIASAFEFIDIHLDDEFDLDESLNEDTVKKGNKWVNKGDEGTHGEFKTKKEADAQRKAMFANGYHEDLEDDFDDDFGGAHCEDDDCELGIKVNWNDIDEEDGDVCPKCHKKPCECLHEEEVKEAHKTGHIKLDKPIELKARENK